MKKIFSDLKNERLSLILMGITFFMMGIVFVNAKQNARIEAVEAQLSGNCKIGEISLSPVGHVHGLFISNFGANVGSPVYYNNGVLGTLGGGHLVTYPETFGGRGEQDAEILACIYGENYDN
jgi:hypothetical protein